MNLRKRVYLESTIPSYLAACASRDLIVAAHQQLTNDWWEIRRFNYDLFVSQFVLDEISLGDELVSRRRLGYLDGIPELKITDSVQNLAAALVSPRTIPKKYAQDAAHIAISAVHSMDFLLTWNCSHIANAEVVPRVAEICCRHGFQCPIICTPEELMGVN